MQTQDPMSAFYFETCTSLHDSQAISNPLQQKSVMVGFSISYWNRRLSPNLLSCHCLALWVDRARTHCSIISRNFTILSLWSTKTKDLWYWTPLPCSGPYLSEQCSLIQLNVWCNSNWRWQWTCWHHFCQHITQLFIITIKINELLKYFD